MIYLQVAFVVIAVLLFFWVDTVWAAWVCGALLGFTILNLIGAIANWVGVKVPVAEINAAIDACMRIGYHRTKIRFQETGGGRCLDFVKLNPATKPTRFFMRLDRGRCSEGEFEAAKELLDAKGLGIDIKEDHKGRSRYLIVECGRDLEKAVTAARTVLTTVFQLPYDAKVRYIVDGGFSLRRNALIGWNRGASKTKQLCGHDQTSHEDVASVTHRPDHAAPSVGATGITLSGGQAEFDGEEFDVVCRGGFADPGTEVEIVEIDGDRIVVQKIEKAKQTPDKSR